MSTTIQTRNGETVATRFGGPCGSGLMIQMEITEKEWSSWKNVDVSEEAYDDFMPFEQWIASQNATIIWDSAARQNTIAREYEEHRFADEVSFFKNAAMECRNRAKTIVRDSFRVV